MNNMRDFVSFYLKRKGIGIDDFLALCGIGRSMFYRFLKEPYRFSDEQLEAMAKSIEIPEKEKAKLLAFKSDCRPADSISKEIEDEIRDILFSNPSEFRVNKSDFEYYDFDKKRTYVTDADGLVDMLSEHIAQIERPDENCLEGYFTIYNCATAQKVSRVYDLLSGLKSRLRKKFMVSRIIHYVDYQKNDLLSKLKMLKANLPLYSTFNDYHLINTDLSEHPWAGRVDFITLKYGRQTVSGTSDWRYMVVNIEHARRAYAYSTDNYQLYKFLACGMDEQGADFEFDASPIEVNEFFKKQFSVTKRITITLEPCLDSIIPTIWHNLIERVKNGPNLKMIRKVLDSSGSYTMYSDAQFFDFLVNSLKSRFEICEKNETIFILTIDGLETFVKQKMMTETLMLDETFTREEARLQLEHIKSRLGDAAASGQESFYIFNARLKQPMYRCIILKNNLFSACSPQNTNHLIATTTLQDKAIANAMYNFIVYEMIDKRDNADSLLMSDSEAGVLLDKLISRMS